jgi:hypothetical protein
MACWNRQSRSAKALRCCQTDGVAGTAYSFMMTAISPVSSAYVYERTNFASAGSPETLPDCRSLCASRRSLSTA